MSERFFALLALFSLVFTACIRAEGPPIAQYGYEVVATYPHSENSFTQGLEFHEGRLFEGTGQNGESRLMEVDLKTGKALRTHALEVAFFGEGITILNGRVYQLTWQERKGFVYELETFKPIREFSYKTEGWGLSNDGKSLIMSDGTAWLYFLDPETLQVTGQVEVTEGGRPVKKLNELEYAGGFVLANIWGSNELVQINPANGQVVGRVNLDGLLPAAERTSKTDVLNGIAWDTKSGKLYVTGKYWPKLYEIRLVAAK